MLCFEFHNKPLNTHGLTGSVCVELVVKTGSVWVSVVVILLTGLITGSVRSEFVAKLVVEHAKHTGWPPCIRLARRARRSKSRVRGGQETPHSKSRVHGVSRSPPGHVVHQRTQPTSRHSRAGTASTQQHQQHSSPPVVRGMVSHTVPQGTWSTSARSPPAGTRAGTASTNSTASTQQQQQHRSPVGDRVRSIQYALNLTNG